MTVLRRSLADRKVSSLWWALGIAGMILASVALYPSVKGSDVDEIVQDLPPAVQAMFGIEGGVSLGSAPGYLQARLFSSVLPVLFLILAVSVGAAAIGGAEEDGAIELLLSNPITRTRVAVERYLSLVAVMAAFDLLAMVGVLAMAPPVGALDDVSIGGLFAATGGAGALALLHGSIAFAVGAATGRRSPAIAGASAIAAAGYLAHGLLSAIDLPTAVRALTPWYWALHENMLVEGPNIESWLPALVLSLVVAGFGVAVFQRRDLR